MLTANAYQTIWISDLHIGSTQCQADVLLDFLKNNESEKLYLVGDIIDFWALSKKVYWPREHNTILQKILRKARHGTQVIYIPGNHDENIRDYDQYVFGDITVKNSDVHATSAGKRFLVVHGDEYDTIAKYHQWIAKLGSKGYDLLLDINRLLRMLRRLFGIQSHFSLAAFVKFKVKNAVQFISDYEESIVNTLKDGRLGRRHLWTHPPCGNERDRGVFICEHRRFRGELHCHRGTPRWTLGTREMA